MKYFSTDQIGRIFVISLNPSDYVLENIKNLVKQENVKDAVVVSAIGTLDYCTLHMVMTTDFPVQNRFENWKDKPLELVHIGGIIANGEPHLHAVVSDHEKAYSGHLEEGCRVLYLAEMVIIELKSMNLARVYDDKHIQRLTETAEDLGKTSSQELSQGPFDAT